VLKKHFNCGNTLIVDFNFDCILLKSFKICAIAQFYLCAQFSLMMPQVNIQVSKGLPGKTFGDSQSLIFYCVDAVTDT